MRSRMKNIVFATGQSQSPSQIKLRSQISRLAYGSLEMTGPIESDRASPAIRRMGNRHI
jgi:hypothetical protein